MKKIKEFKIENCNEIKQAKRLPKLKVVKKLICIQQIEIRAKRKIKKFTWINLFCC